MFESAFLSVDYNEAIGKLEELEYRGVKVDLREAGIRTFCSDNALQDLRDADRARMELDMDVLFSSSVDHFLFDCINLSYREDGTYYWTPSEEI